MSWYSGPGSQKPSRITAAATSRMAVSFQGIPRRGGRPGFGRAQIEPRHVHEKPAKIVTTPARKRNADQPWWAHQRRAQHREFALEEAERRRAGHRQGRQQEQAAGPRQRANHPADLQKERRT